MTKAKAIDNFFNSFGLSAYPSTRVPDNVTFPYLTYEPTMANNGRTTSPRVCLWYYGESEKPINAKADQISKAIGMGTSIRCDDGAICIYNNEEWQALEDQADAMISGRFTNLMLMFNTK